MMAQLDQSNHPLIMDFKELVELFPQYPQFDGTGLLEMGYRDCLTANLKVGDKSIGMFCINALQKGFFTPAIYPLFQSVTYSISIAVANILANEEILEREREKTNLLSISEAISKINNRQELLRVVYQHIQPLFPFDSAGLFVMDKEKDVIYEILDSEAYPDALQKQLTDENNLGPWKLSRSNKKSWWMQQDIVINTVNQEAVYASGQVGDEQFKAGLAYGLKHMIGGPMYANGKKIGAICFGSKQPDFYSSVHLSMFRSISGQVAVAVANILANEEIREREKEKTLLLNISNSIAKINHKADLLKSINELLWPIFHHDDACFCVVDKEKKYFTDYYNLYSKEIPEVPTVKGVIYKQIYKKNDSRLPFPGSFVEYAMNESPAVGKLSDILHLTIHGHLVKSDIEAGLMYYMCSPLNAGGKSLGLFMLDFKEQNKPTATALHLFAQIAEMMAMAMSNILASEEILEREQEKTVLLEITESIASIRNKVDLLKVVIDKIKPVFDFYDSAIVLVDKEGEYHEDLAASNPAIDGSASNQSIHQEFSHRINKIAHPGSIVAEHIQEVTLQNKPILVDLERVYREQSDSHPFLPIMQETGLKQAMVTNLKVGSRIIGNFYLNSSKPAFFSANRFHIFQAIADQVAVAVANIQANEEILKQKEEIEQREKEKTLQIAVNTTLNKEGTWQEKFLEIARLLEEIIPWDVVSFDLDFINRAFTYVKGKNGPAYMGLDDFVRDSGLSAEEIHHLKAGSIDHYYTAGICTGEAYEQACRQYPFKKLMSRMFDIHSSLHAVAPIRNGQNIVITFTSRQPDGYRQEQLGFLQRIAPSLSLAVQKLLAYEEIEGREREKALQVAVINALTEDGSWEEKLLRLTRVLQKSVPFDYLFLMLEKDKQYGRGYACLRIGFDEYQSIDTESFYRMTGINQQKYLALREQRVYAKPELLQGETFEKAAAKYGLLGLTARTFKLQSSIAIPLKLSHQGRFLLNIFSKKPQGLLPEYLALLEKIASPLAITLENLLAYEEIKQLKERLEVEKEYLEDEINTNYKFEDIVGASQSLKEVFKKVSQVATTDSTVLVLGETGTGKELIARAIHNLSRRSERALVKINCAALPAQLIESELFGHERGAFTGAVDRRIGKFELAHGGTIFLDEVGELPLELQAKLLRAIQEKEVERLGGNKIVKTDVRIIAATNRNLEKAVAQGHFRTDLYFRLNVFPVTLPPLRNRKEDIPLLTVHFVRKMGKKLGKNITGISNAAIKEMQAYNWPGNIRELEHIIERAAITASGIINDLGLPEKESELVAFPVGGFVQRTLAHNERDLILETLKRCNGRIRGKGGVAQVLDIEPNTLDARMKKLGIIKKQSFENKT